MTLTIGYLADHPESIPVLMKWFRRQWPDYYANRSDLEMELDFLSDASRDRIPIRLVAFDSGALTGTIVLRDYKGEAQPKPLPELGGLYVAEAHRRRGTATELVRAGMQLAGDLGYETVLATTVAAAGILESLGWMFVKTVVHQDGELSLYRYSLPV